MTTKEKAVQMLKKDASYKEVAAQTGINIPTLRTWKKRYVVDMKEAKPTKPKVSEGVTNVSSKETTNEKELRKAYDGLIETLQSSKKQLVTEYDNVVSENEILKTEIETLQSSTDETAQSDTKQNMTYYNLPLIVGILALHVSAVYGVGEILKAVFHTYVMGYLTALVFVSAGLIMFASKRFSIGISWLVLIATFLIESYCNYLTIYMNMSDEKLQQFQSYTNTGILFFCISVSIPLVNLALEYLLFTPTNVE